MSGNILLRKISFLDYPGRISTVLFFSGCNLRCPWCHNGDLVTGNAEGLSSTDFVSFEEALAYITKRKTLIGGVVLSGGEPCLTRELPAYIKEIKRLKLPVKLDTNGMFPAVLEKLFSSEETSPDYIALDLKAAPSRYAELLPPANAGEEADAGVFNAGEALRQSAALIRGAGITHEYRTLALPSFQRSASFITEKDIEELAPLVDNSPWYFRLFRGGNCLDPSWNSLEETQNQAGSRAKALADKALELGKNGVYIQE